MNTYTNAVHPKKEVHRTARNRLFSNVTVIAVILTLVTAVAVAVYISNRPVAAAENDLTVAYSNALEMQYAQPWLEPQGKAAVAFGNALELQYARPWLEARNKSVVAYGNALELQYAQPWLETRNAAIVTYGDALELQYAQPWLDKAEVSYGNALELQYAQPWLARAALPLHCSSSMEMLYACKYGYSHP